MAKGVFMRGLSPRAVLPSSRMLKPICLDQPVGSLRQYSVNHASTGYRPFARRFRFRPEFGRNPLSSAASRGRDPPEEHQGTDRCDAVQRKLRPSRLASPAIIAKSAQPPSWPRFFIRPGNRSRCRNSSRHARADPSRPSRYGGLPPEQQLEQLQLTVIGAGYPALGIVRGC